MIFLDVLGHVGETAQETEVVLMGVAAQQHQFVLGGQDPERVALEVESACADPEGFRGRLAAFQSAEAVVQFHHYDRPVRRLLAPHLMVSSEWVRAQPRLCLLMKLEPLFPETRRRRGDIAGPDENIEVGTGASLGAAVELHRQQQTLEPERGNAPPLEGRSQGRLGVGQEQRPRGVLPQVALPVVRDRLGEQPSPRGIAQVPQVTGDQPGGGVSPSQRPHRSPIDPARGRTHLRGVLG